jgi:hypothetical protein
MLHATVVLISAGTYRVDVRGTSEDGATEHMVCQCGPYDYRAALACEALFDGVACNRVHRK